MIFSAEKMLTPDLKPFGVRYSRFPRGKLGISSEVIFNALTSRLVQSYSYDLCSRPIVLVIYHQSIKPSSIEMQHTSGGKILDLPMKYHGESRLSGLFDIRPLGFVFFTMMNSDSRILIAIGLSDYNQPKLVTKLLEEYVCSKHLIEMTQKLLKSCEPNATSELTSASHAITLTQIPLYLRRHDLKVGSTTSLPLTLGLSVKAF